MISLERIHKVETALKDNNTAVRILWDQQERVGKDYQVPVQCIHDGFTEVRYVSTIMKGKFFCQECAIRKYSEKLSNFDFTFIELLPSEDKQSRKVLFSCNSCKFERRLSVGNILNTKSLSCDNCRKLKVKQNLADKCCTFIESFLDSRGFCRVIYKDVNGQEKEVYESNILRYNFSPSDSHWEQEHYLYVFISDNPEYPFIKIGTANRPDNRLKSLKLDFDCSIISCKFDTRYAANKIEKEMHRIFSDFSVDKTIAEGFTKGLSKPTKAGKRIRQGCTEWFRKECLSGVLDKSNSLGIELT